MESARLIDVAIQGIEARPWRRQLILQTLTRMSLSIHADIIEWAKALESLENGGMSDSGARIQPSAAVIAPPNRRAS
jgi:hypothetical protein